MTRSDASVSTGRPGCATARPALTAIYAANAARTAETPVRPALTAIYAVNAARTAETPALPALTAIYAVNAARTAETPCRPALTGTSGPLLNAAVQTPAPPPTPGGRSARSNATASVASVLPSGGLSPDVPTPDLEAPEPPAPARRRGRSAAAEPSASRQPLLGVLGLEEDAVGDDAGDRLLRPLDLELGAELGVLDRDHRVADVAIEPRRVAGGRDAPHLATARADREEVRHRVVVVRAELRPADLDSDQLAVDAPIADGAQRLAADEVLLLLELDHPLVAVADLVRVLLDRHVAAVREDPSLDAPDVARAGRGEAVRLAGLDERVPQPQSVTAGIAQIEFIAELARVARSRDHEPHAVELAVDHVVVGNVEDVGAEQVGHDLLGLRALDLKRSDVGLRDAHVEARVIGETLAPEQHVAVGQREPEVVLV